MATTQTAAVVERPKTSLVTADELLHLPSGEFRYELIKGEVRQMTPAGFYHGRIGMKLAGPLNQFVEAHNLGVVCLAETGFRIAQNPDTVRAPDIAFVLRERIPESGLPQGYFPGAPDLAVEVVSPGDTVYEVEEKITDWLEAGTLAVWVVNPKQRSVAIHHDAAPVIVLRENDELDGGEVVPGFRLPVAALFN